MMEVRIVSATSVVLGGDRGAKLLCKHKETQSGNQLSDVPMKISVNASVTIQSCRRLTSGACDCFYSPIGSNSGFTSYQATHPMCGKPRWAKHMRGLMNYE